VSSGVFARQPVSRHDDLRPLAARLAAQRGAAIDARVRAWVDGATIDAALDAAVTAALAGVHDLARAADKRALCPVPGLNDQDYLVRLLASPDGRHVLAELRFKGLDLAQPFVELVGADFALSAHTTCQLCAAIASQFRRARPRWLRIYRGAHEPDDAMWDELPWLPDLRVVVGPVSAIRAGADPGATGLVLRPATADSLTAFRDAFAAFAAAEPALAAEVTALTDDDAGALIRAGTLYDGWLGHRWVGHIGVRPTRFLGAPAFEVVSEIVAPAARGRGLGPALQRALAHRLDPDALLVGTVHATNRPSLATALRVGRIDVGGWRFLDL
jgi:GNAT superfamily N-acetyltransferase